MSRKQEGFTLIELLVGISLLGILMVAVFNLAMGSAKLHQVDQQRADDDRTLRGTMDILSADVREAGELLQLITPAIEVYDLGGSSALKLLKGLSDTPLPLCSPIVQQDSEQTVYIAGTTSTTNNPKDVKFADGSRALPEACGATAGTVNAWNTVLTQKSALGEGDTAQGIIIDVIGKRLGDFTLKRVGPGDVITISNVNLAGNPARTLVSDPPQDYRLFLVEKRTYWVQDGTLYLDRDNKGGAIVMRGVVDFTVDPIIGANKAALPFGALFASPSWRDLSSLDIKLSRKVGQTTRTLSESILPRNSLSKDKTNEKK